MASLAELRAKSKANLDKLREKTKEGSQWASNEDKRLWKIERGKDGNAFAIIRFLPVSKIDEETNSSAAMPWVKIHNHSFQNTDTGRWYIEKSLSTIGQPDPVYEMNRKLYALKTPEGEAKAKKQKRKTNYYSNVYIVKDPAHPENEGKVFLFRYGQKIHDKLKSIIDPETTFGEEPSDPFDFDTGRDFRLKIRTVDEYPNYDLSEFDKPNVISDKNGKALSDTEMEEVWNTSYSLLGFLDAKEFKSYDELQKRLDFVEGKEGSEQQKSTPKSESAPAEKKQERTPAKEEAKPASTSNDEEADVDLDSLLADLED